MSQIASVSRQDRNEAVDIQKKAAEKKQDLREKSQSEIDQLKKTFASKKEQLEQQNQAVVNHLRTRQSELQENGDETIQNLKKDQVEDINEARQKFKAQVNNQQTYSKKVMSDLRERTTQVLKNESEKAAQAKADLIEKNQKTYDKVQVEGMNNISEKIRAQDSRIARLDSEFEKKYTAQRDKWDNKKERMEESFQDRIQREKEGFKSRLETARENHESTLSKTKDQQSEAIMKQQERFGKQLIQKQQEFIKVRSKYENKEDDPFYRIEDRGSELHETASSYILKAYVPEYEKETVHVQVHNDKAVISGQRGFNDKVKDENKAFSTSSYQTFREEFNFEQPIYAKGISKEREGDWIFVTIPKFGSYKKS